MMQGNWNGDLLPGTLVLADEDVVLFHMTQLTRPVSINEVAGRSRFEWRRRVHPWRTQATAGCSAWLRQALGRPVSIDVKLEWEARGARRRDPHNFTSTVVKAVVDGIVDAGVVADDSSTYVRVYDSVIHEVSMSKKSLSWELHLAWSGWKGPVINDNSVDF